MQSEKDARGELSVVCEAERAIEMSVGRVSQKCVVRCGIVSWGGVVGDDPNGVT